MLQMVCQPVHNGIVAVSFAVFRVSHGNAASRPALILVFLPEELQGDTHPFQFLMHISVIGSGIHGFLYELVRIEHAVNRVFIHVSDIFVGDAMFICFVKYITNRVDRNVSCTGNGISSHSIAPKLQYELHIDFFGHNIRPPFVESETISPNMILQETLTNR